MTDEQLTPEEQLELIIKLLPLGYSQKNILNAQLVGALQAAEQRGRETILPCANGCTKSVTVSLCSACATRVSDTYNEGLRAGRGFEQGRLIEILSQPIFTAMSCGCARLLRKKIEKEAGE